MGHIFNKEFEELRKFFNLSDESLSREELIDVASKTAEDVVKAHSKTWQSQQGKRLSRHQQTPRDHSRPLAEATKKDAPFITWRKSRSH